MVGEATKRRREGQTGGRFLAKWMRHEPVASERLFWSAVRDRKLAGYKFKRQVPIGPYIADFACVQRKLVVELDGPFHADLRDQVRDLYLRNHGYRVLRISNSEINNDFGAAMAKVLHALEVDPPHP
jgi:very-short-patch-repair endonuclease